MNIDEFRNALRTLLNDAAKSGLDVDDILEAADLELHPAFETEPMLDAPIRPQLCAGGIEPGWGACPRCGATMDDSCKFDESETVDDERLGEK